ncbi:phage holin family protein [Eubacteriales bacterium OttesenSCG-928-M02]|nr:phage holin family protein [Eubacteriales bacterium OttesenSCG-928-M02]
MEIIKLLQPYLVVMVMGICLCVGFIIKHSLDFVPNKYIPFIMGVLGVMLNVWLNGWYFTPEILLGGLASGLASTGAFELVRQVMEKEERTEEPIEKE